MATVSIAVVLSRVSSCVIALPSCCALYSAQRLRRRSQSCEVVMSCLPFQGSCCIVLAGVYLFSIKSCCVLEDGVSSLVVLLQQSASEAIGFVGYCHSLSLLNPVNVSPFFRCVMCLLYQIRCRFVNPSHH